MISKEQPEQAATNFSKYPSPVAPPPLVIAGEARLACPFKGRRKFLNTVAASAGDRFACEALSGSFELKRSQSASVVQPNPLRPRTYAKIIEVPLLIKDLTAALHPSFLRLESTRMVGTKAPSSSVTPGAGERFTFQSDPKAIFLLSL